MIFYLASPYSDPNLSTRERRAREVRRYAAALLSKGIIVFSPIAMTHEMAEDRQLPYEFAFWERFNRAFLNKSAGLYVAKIKGWDQSKGVAAEIAIAKELEIPVFYVELDDRGNLILTMDPAI